jgi:hypothetical protein
LSANFHYLLILGVLLTSATLAHAQSDAVNLESQMTPAQFKAAGLDKLTPEELAKLNEFIQQSGQKLTTQATGATRQADTRSPAALAPTVTDATAPAVSPAPAGQQQELAAAQAAARAAEAEAAAALAAAQAAEADARARAEAAAVRQAAAEAEAAEAQAAAAARQQEATAIAAALADQPFQNGRWVGPKPEQVRARIDGKFEGWDGDTLFVLDNGEVWKQRTRGRYIHDAESPEVLITRNTLGFFVLEMVDTGKSVGVKRVR